MMMIRDLGATAWRARHLCVGGGGVMTDGEHLCAERTHACTNKGLTSCLLSSASFSFELDASDEWESIHRHSFIHTLVG